MASQPVRDPSLDALLSPKNAALVFIDYQPPQVNTIASMDRPLLINNVVALAKLGKLYGLPILLSTVNVLTGVNADTIPQLRDVLTGVPSIDRTSINAWEDVDFVNAVVATGRRKLILAALWTEACLTFYAAERFAYFIDRTAALAQQLLTESGKRDSKGAIKGTAATASETAKLLRNRVLRRLETYAGDRVAEGDEIKAARGSIADDDATAGSIHDLVKLARAWIARPAPPRTRSSWRRPPGSLLLSSKRPSAPDRPSPAPRPTRPRRAAPAEPTLPRSTCVKAGCSARCAKPCWPSTKPTSSTGRFAASRRARGLARSWDRRRP